MIITDGATDSITIHYSDSQYGGAPIIIKTVGQPANPNANDVGLDDNFGCRAGDTTLISPLFAGTACGMSSVSAVSPVGAIQPFGLP